jgi:predicted nucleic acid-binding protein
MKGILVDANVALDIFTNDPVWFDWSELILSRYSATHVLYINPVIYAELSVGFESIEKLEEAISQCGFQLIPIPKKALFLAGKAFIKYRKQYKGNKLSPLPDFFIGAHAAEENLPLMTRDIRRFKTYFPTVMLISPENEKI